jgi:hypothetical protein
MRDLSVIRAQYDQIKQQCAVRDTRMRAILSVRRGDMRSVYPDLFPEGPFANGIVANMVDVAARDLSEVMAPLPTFTCASATMVSDKAKAFAGKRSRIVNGYIDYSDLQRQMYTAADRYVTYGFVPAMIEVSIEDQMPRISFMDSMGCYPVKDRWGRVQAIFFAMMKPRAELIALFPEARGILEHGMGRNPSADMVELVRYHDKDVDMLFLPSGQDRKETVVLQSATNPLGKCLAVVIQRPGVDDEAHGQFDDVLSVQVAKARFALLALEAATKSVQAPIALPQDVQELALGSDSVLRSANPEKIRRVPIEVPPVAFAQQASLDQELRAGSRYPQVRGGEVEGSIVTGKGVQALLSGFDTQVRTAQSMFARGLSDLVRLCLLVDERVFGDVDKTIRGNQDGTPYEIKYRPSKDISGDHSVDVQYGLMAGLDPNRALVFGLQARGDKLISRDFLRTQMPFALNSTEEEQRIDIEEMRDALKQAVAGYAQAIPVLAQNGQDPGEILSRLSVIIAGRQKGDPIEDIVREAFAPPEPEPGMMPPDAEASPFGSPAEAVPGSGIPAGMQANGLLSGVASGQAGMSPGGRPDLQTLLAGLTGGGQPNLQAAVSRRVPI